MNKVLLCLFYGLFSLCPFYIGRFLQAQDTISLFRSSVLRQNNFTTALNQELRLEKKIGNAYLQIRHGQEALYNQSLESRKMVQANAANHLWIKYRTHKNIQPLIFIESDAFLNSKNGRSQWYAGTAIRPFRNMEWIPLIGYNVDVRNGRPDHGNTFATFFSWYPISQIGTTRMNLNGYSRVKFIAPRRQDNHRLNFDLNKILPGGGRVFFLSNASFHELDDYQSRSVERMLSDTLSGQVGGSFKIAKYFFAEADQRLTSQQRKFKYRSLVDSPPEFNNTGFRQEEIQSNLRLSLRRNRLSAYVSYEFLLLERKYFLENQLQLAPALFQEFFNREAQKNYRSAFQKWMVFSRWRFHHRHALEVEYSSQYLKYDTPLNSNQDDRDEITYIFRATWESRWRSNFFISQDWTAQSRYSGFLSGNRSRDNYHQYNLKYRIQSEWQFAPGWVLKSANAVYVTYNVKTLGDPQFTDRSTRFLEHQVDLSGQWHRRWRSSLVVERKAQHLSYLNWSGFSETPLDTTWFTTLQQLNEYTWGGKSGGLTWTFCGGYRYFLLSRNNATRLINPESNDVKIALQSFNRQAGFISELKLRTWKANVIGLKIWWQKQVVWNKAQNISEDTYVVASITKQELDVRQRIFRPYFEINLSLTF